MIRSENTLAHAFISLFSERTINVPQLFTAISLVHPYQITLRPIQQNWQIIHAEAERMKSKRSGRDPPFIKIKCDDLKQAEAVILGELLGQKSGIIFRVEEFRTTPSIQQSLKCQGFGHKVPNYIKKPKCVVCSDARSYKSSSNKEKSLGGLPIKSDGGSECWALPLTLKYKKKFLFLTTLEYIFCKTEAPEV